MPNCDLCNRTILLSELVRIPKNDFQKAVQEGFNPFKVPGIDMSTAKRLAAAFGMSSEQMYPGWRQRVMSDPTDWGLCPACANALHGAIPPALARAQFESKTSMCARGIGMVFNIDDLGGEFYGSKAWRIFMRNLPPEYIIGCTLKEGDTQETLNGSQREFCIAVFGLVLDEAFVRETFEYCTEKGLAPSARRFISSPRSEPLVDAGFVDSLGRLVQDEWSRMFHDRCKDSGWGYSPKSVTVDLLPELKSELDNLRNKKVSEAAQEAAKKRAEEWERKAKEAERKRREEEDNRRAEAQKRRQARKAENERRAGVQATRKSSGKCIMCGSRLGFVLKLLGKGKHSRCTSFKEETPKAAARVAAVVGTLGLR